MPKPKKTKVMTVDERGVFHVTTTVHGVKRDAVLRGMPTVEITETHIRTGCICLTHEALYKL